MTVAHRIDPGDRAKLEAPERRKRLPPDRVLDLLDPRPGTRCLDLGCGTGYLTRPLAVRVGERSAVGLDRSRLMLAELAERARRRGVRPQAVLGSATQLPFRRASFARVLSVNLHHEVDERERMLAETVRALEPGGSLLVVDWAPVETETGPPIEHRLPAETIAAELTEAGFEAVEILDGFEQHSAVTGRRSTRP